MEPITIHPAVEDFLEKLYRPAGRPLVMGIINTTPDSFYDKSRAMGIAALETALRFVLEGADILDIGGESTRPGSSYVSADEEISRVVPLIRSIRQETQIPISVDTRKAPVARAALEAGANVINDISALRDDPALGELAAASGVPVILMHMQGTPQTMQQDPEYHDVLQEVRSFLQQRIDYAQGLGIACEKIIIDPGIGFGKAHAHNLLLLRHLDKLADLGYPVLMGHSRKSFIGRILAGEGAEGRGEGGDPAEPAPADQRLFGSLAVVADSYYRGARLFRVHDVRETRELLDVCHAISRAGW
jgi:dihydropteroate synthase